MVAGQLNEMGGTIKTVETRFNNYPSLDRSLCDGSVVEDLTVYFFQATLQKIKSAVHLKKIWVFIFVNVEDKNVEVLTVC